MKKILLALILLLQLTPAFAQKIDVVRKTGLITVDGTPSFYMMPRNRVLFITDYSVENLQHQELAYLRAIQRPAYSPAYGNSTETFFVMTFTQSGNTCELHGFSSFSITKSLARSIAAANLIQNNQISSEAERKFIMIYHGVFVQDPSGGRPGNPNGGQGRYDDRDQRDEPNADSRNSNAADEAPYSNNDRHTGEQYPDSSSEASDNNTNSANEAPPAPLNINIDNGKIYDGNELIATYKPLATGVRNETAYTIFDNEQKELATVRRSGSPADDWQVTMAADGRKVMIRYRAESPLVKLFTAMAEKGYL